MASIQAKGASRPSPAWSIYPTGGRGPWRRQDRAGSRADHAFRLALQMARDDYEDRRERQRQGIELARQAGRYKGRRADPKRRAQVVALRKSGYSINKTAELAGYSAAQVKRIWAEVSQAEAKQHGAFVEDALTEADALAAVGQDERQEERA